MFKNIFFQKHEIKYRQAVLFFNTLKALVFSETPHHKCSVTMMWCRFRDELCDATLPEHIVGIVTALYRFLSTSYKREADLIKLFFFSVNSLFLKLWLHIVDFIFSVNFLFFSQFVRKPLDRVSYSVLKYCDACCIAPPQSVSQSFWCMNCALYWTLGFYKL